MMPPASSRKPQRSGKQAGASPPARKSMLAYIQVSVYYCITLPYRMLKELLEDLIFFVLGKENSKSCKPLDVTGTPSRERQKLCREQNILAEVMHIRSIYYCMNDVFVVDF